jgi:hypothetical protein
MRSLPNVMTGRSSASAGSRAPVTREFLLAALVFTAALVVYLPSLGNDFAYDDVPIIVLDERVREFDLRGILTEGYWQDTQTALYRPLATVSYAIDWRLTDGSAGWFHFVNGLWHAVVALLVLLLLRALRAPPGAAVIGAMVFAVHPVHVEAVANTAAACTLSAALLWAARPRTVRHARGLTALAILFALALLSKESAVVLPGLLLLVDVALGRLRPSRMAVWLRCRRTPLLLLSTVLVLFFVLRMGLIGALAPANLDPNLEVLTSPVHRIYTALQAWPQYARLLFYPRVLLADYGPRILLPAVSIQPVVVLGAGLLALCLIGGVVAWIHGRRLTAAALLWFFVSLFPASNLIVPIGVVVAERTLYLPSVALSMGIAALGTVVRRPLPRPVVAGLAALVGAVLLLLAGRTVVRIPEWETTHTIFSALRRDRPDSFRAAWHFARVAVARGEPVEALALHAEAINLWPYRRKLIQEAAAYASQQGEIERAQQLTGFALGRWPDDLPLRHLHAGILLDRGDTVNALLYIEDGLRRYPADGLLLRMLHAATGDTESAGPES